MGDLFKKSMSLNIGNSAASWWGRGYFDAKKKDEFPGTVRNKHTVGDLRAQIGRASCRERV